MEGEAATQVSGLWPFLVYALSVVALLAVTLTGAWFLGGRVPKTAATNEPYESGVVPVGDTQVRLSIEFYLVAMFFVIFDLETIFIFAWAVSFQELGWRGYLGASAFILVLVVALIYELKTGALDWGTKRRTVKRFDDYAHQPAPARSAPARSSGRGKITAGAKA